jgi:Tfp pilus assembly protein PilV
MRLLRGLRRRAVEDGGYTLVEVLVSAVLSVMVLGIAGAGLVSLASSSTRATSMTSSQEEVSAAAAILAKDLRSTDRLVAAGASSFTAEVNQASGSPLAVTWSVSGGTLSRQVTGSAAQTLLTGLTSSAVFGYYSGAGAPLTGEVNATLLDCTTLVRVNLEQGAASAVTPYDEVVSLALTDRAESLSAQGGGGC